MSGRTANQRGTYAWDEYSQAEPDEPCGILDDALKYATAADGPSRRHSPVLASKNELFHRCETNAGHGVLYFLPKFVIHHRIAAKSPTL